MLRIAFALILGMFGFCDIIYGILHGLDSISVQYMEGSYHLIRGYIFFKICMAMMED